LYRSVVVPMSHEALPPAPVTPLPPLSVAVETIGVMTIAMIGSSVSSQLVDLDIADIGGSFSISADSASWIACIATMTEVAAIPLAATLVRVLTLRPVVIGAAGLFALTAFASLNVRGVPELLVLRAIQSFAEGTISVLMFVAVMTTLPAGPKRGIGLAVFGLASTAPSAFAAWVGAVFVDRLGWQGLYVFDIAWALVVLCFAIGVLRPGSSVIAMRLREIDWVGYALLAAGAASFILFVKQGDRFFWLQNPIIVRAGVLAALLIPASIAVFVLRRHPLLDLSLMKTVFGWAFTLATFYRFGMVMTAFVVPQALSRLQGFRIEQVAEANMWMFWAECVAFPLAWFWASRWDARLPLSLGLLLLAVGAFLSTRLTPAWQSNDFALTEIAIGLGQGLFLVPTLFYATRDVLPQQGPTAAALFNLSRVVGQTFGIGVIAAVIRYRQDYHSAVIVDSFNNANPALVERFNGLVAMFLGTHGDHALAQQQAWASLSSTASTQAYVLAFADTFVIVAIVMALSALLVLMLPPLRDPAPRPNEGPQRGLRALILKWLS
jgi:MFS transporter, DHA2 family, multidrug resistance protein